MKAIILAAGYGKRMRPLTDTTHKTMLRVGGRTVIEWTVDALVESEVTDLVVVTGYRADDLKAHLTRIYPHLPITYVDNERYAHTNNIYSLALAFESLEIDGDVIVVESDLVFQPSVLQRLLASEHRNVALVDRFRSGMDGTVVSLGDDRVITNVIPPHLQGKDFSFDDKYKTLNIYRFSKEFCELPFRRLLTYYARAIDDNCYYELILGIVIYMQRATVHAEIVDDEAWAEVDDPNDLDRARFVFEPETRREVLDGAFGGYWNYEVLDFCFIRNMYFPTGAVVAELRGNLERLLQSYGSSQLILNRKLAYFLLCSEENVTAVNGLSQVYPLLRQYFAGKRALLPAPTFGEYAGAFPAARTYPDDIGIDPQEIVALSRETDVVVLVNPNNPTGSMVAPDWICGFARTLPMVTVVVDESFVEFSGSPSVLSLLETSPVPNVIVLKSFSKTLGVPGARLGCTYSWDAVFNEYMRGSLPVWNLNAVAENFLELILKHRGAIEESFARTVRDRDEFARRLGELPVIGRVHPSGANFLLVSLRGDRLVGERICEHLLREGGIYVRNVSRKFAGNSPRLRFAVRLPEENHRVIEGLRSFDWDTAPPPVAADAAAQ